MGAHQVALSRIQTLSSIQARSTGDRQVHAMTSQYSGAKVLHGDSVGMSTVEKKRLHGGTSISPIRSEATPATRGDDDEPKYHLYRQPSRGSTWSTSNFGHKHLINGQHPLVNRSIAKSTTTTTKGLKLDETTNDDDKDGSELDPAPYCDVVLPHSLACEFLHLASRICDEVESKLNLHKSKKPQRLSTTSWDLLD
ncbi:hypothetical protein KC19_2G227500 [Ceratodon purpureus]|uniref:Uncharacterized protein n=1 Tax=Ceratodon purpureus TaxID=3225 RepID=A0A8T0J0Q6_CERPU|nr:hypothetical protein KC19_2G227500 [Ceratodon purpureus]